jgi:hypothetical protein
MVLFIEADKFGNLEIELKALNCEMTEQGYSEKIKEAFKQMEIDIE